MSAEIVNLRMARKARARADKAKQAEENRIRFGRTKNERNKQAAETERSNKHLDGARIDQDPPDGEKN